MTEVWKLLASHGYVGLRHDELPYLARLGRWAIREMTTKGEHSIVIDDSVLDYFWEIVSVYGHLLLARDEIRKWQAEVPGNSDYAKYHFYAFVFHTKAFLDKVAAYLNWEYDLAFQRGSIDFKNREFVATLRKRRPALGREVLRFRRWFVEVQKWRDHLIHREGVWLMPIKVPGVKEYDRTTRQIQIPRNPELGRWASSRSGRMPAFCEKWLAKAESLLALVSQESARTIQRRWPVRGKDRGRVGKTQPLLVEKGRSPRIHRVNTKPAGRQKSRLETS